MSERREMIAMWLDEVTQLSTEELCELGGVSVEELELLVHEGLIEPSGGGAPGQWRFPAGTLARVRRVQRLRRDLGVNLEGAVLAVELIDEVRSLRRQVERLRFLLRW